MADIIRVGEIIRQHFIWRVTRFRRRPHKNQKGKRHTARLPPDCSLEQARWSSGARWFPWLDLSLSL